MKKELTRAELYPINSEDYNTGQEVDSMMVNELRNYHVKKLLNHLGGPDVPPYLQKAIKRSYSEFAEDITTKKDIHNGHDTSNDRFNQ
jgi:hypothetical protein